MVMKTSSRGFTLLESVLVVALAGLILTGAASLIFSMMQLKVAADEAPQEAEHIANVRRFLEFVFTEAKPIENLGEEGGEPDGPVSWRSVPGSSDLNDMALAFRLPGDIPLFVDDEIYMPAVDCYLRLMDGEGLYLYWQTDMMADEDVNDLRRSLITPLVTKMEYLWYDVNDETWDTAEDAEENDEGGYDVPDFIRLTFRGDDPDKLSTALLLLPPAGDEETPRL